MIALERYQNELKGREVHDAKKVVIGCVDCITAGFNGV